MLFPGIVAKLHRALTFLATIGNDFPRDAVSGDDFDSGDAHDERGRYFRSASDGRSARRAKSGIARRAKALCGLSSGGTTAMLSVDQFLRFISVPALFAAFIIASQISAALSPV